MSRLEELQDQLKQKFQETFEKIKETELYQKLDEKYKSLSPQGQKIVRYLSAILLIFVFIFSPVSQLQMSSTFIEEFESKRELLRDMFKTYRESSVTNMMPQPPSSVELIQQIQTTLSGAQLLPQQIVSVSAIEPEGKLIPKNIINNVVSVQLATLNIRQAVDIGTQLANISGSIKVKDLLMSASHEKAGYFDVTYKLYAFNVPKTVVEAAPEAPDLNKGKKKKVDDSVAAPKDVPPGADE